MIDKYLLNITLEETCKKSAKKTPRQGSKTSLECQFCFSQTSLIPVIPFVTTVIINKRTLFSKDAIKGFNHFLKVFNIFVIM